MMQKHVVNNLSEVRLERKHPNFLTELDGLLMFIQKTNPDWVHSQLERLVQSDIHLVKFIEVLTNFIIEDAHPLSTRHALVWLEYFLRNYSDYVRLPQIRKFLRLLCSHVNHLSQLDTMYLQASIRGLAVENWSKSISKINFLPHNLYYDDTLGIPSSNYVYTDGEELLPTKSKLSDTKYYGAYFEHDSDLSATNSSDGDEDDNQSPDLDYHSTESDAGVFDVNNEVIDSEPSLIDFLDHEESEDDKEFGESFANENCVVDDVYADSQATSDSDNEEEGNIVDSDQDELFEQSDEDVDQTLKHLEDKLEDDKHPQTATKKDEDKSDQEQSGPSNKRRRPSPPTPTITPERRQSKRLKMMQTSVSQSADKGKATSVRKDKRKSL